MPIDRVFVLTCDVAHNNNILSRPICFKNDLDALAFVRGLEEEGFIDCEDYHFYKYTDYKEWSISARRTDNDDYAVFTITEADVV